MIREPARSSGHTLEGSPPGNPRRPAAGSPPHGLEGPLVGRDPPAGARVTGPPYGDFVRVGLVGCVKAKRTTVSPAEDLYVSTLFAGRRRYVERTCDQWFVLSAKHGLLEPTAPVEPYDETLKTKGRLERRRWSESVLEQLDAALGDVAGATFEVHAGAEYREHGLTTGLLARGAHVEVPVEGLRIGEQLAFYAR